MSAHLAKKVQMKNYENHVKRLQGVTSAVDSSKPINKKPPKTKLLVERRMREDMINQENCNMLDRLATIMRTKRIDNEGPDYLKHRSLSANTARKHQLQRITQENKRLLQRIQQVNPIIDHMEFEIRARKNEYLKRQLSDFKEVPLPPQVETWLLQKNKLLRESKRRSSDGGEDLSSPKREVYCSRGLGQGSVLRRSQSAKAPNAAAAAAANTRYPEQCEYDEDANEEIAPQASMHRVEEGAKEKEMRSANIATTTTTRRRRRSKQAGRKDDDAAAKNSSPLRGRIRPKSGRI